MGGILGSNVPWNGYVRICCACYLLQEDALALADPQCKLSVTVISSDVNFQSVQTEGPKP